MKRRTAIQLSGAVVLTLFYPAADSRQSWTQDEFIARLRADNEKLRQLLSSRGWPKPTSFLGENVDISNRRVEKQYTGMTVQTKKGPRYVLIQLIGNDFKVAGVYMDHVSSLPITGGLKLPDALREKNIPWLKAKALLDNM